MKIETPFKVEQEVLDEDTVRFKICDSRLSKVSFTRYHVFKEAEYGSYDYVDVKRNPIGDFHIALYFIAFISGIFIVAISQTLYHEFGRSGLTPIWLWLYYTPLLFILIFVMERFFISNFDARVVKKKKKVDTLAHEIYQKELEADKEKVKLEKLLV